MADKNWPALAHCAVIEEEIKGVKDVGAVLDFKLRQQNEVMLRFLEEKGKLTDVRYMLLLCYGEEETGPPPHYLFHGITLDKTQYKIVFEDETEHSVRLKIVKIQTGEEE